MNRYILTTTILLVVAINMNAQLPSFDKDEYTVIVQNPITPVKDQNRSGTCWAYASLAYFESEILRKTGRVYDLSEMFLANKDYMDCAVYHVRMHGESRFSEGGSVTDALEVARNYGLCPQSAMPIGGSLSADSLANFTEFFSLLKPYVEAVAKPKEDKENESKVDKISPQWKVGMQKILDQYLGACPETFEYEGMTYTPMTFANSLGLDFDDYVSVTSYTHHPFYKRFPIEAPYKWRFSLSYNLPLDEMMQVIDDALMAGYTVAWGGDVSEPGFFRDGFALSLDMVNFKEFTPSQKRRQERFDSHEQTYDHVMLIYGMVKDKDGNILYMVKNSWGKTGDFDGIWYMTRNFIADNTVYVVVNKHAIKRKLWKKLKNA